MYEKLEKLTEHLLSNLHSLNLVNTMQYFNGVIHKLCKIQFQKKLLVIRLPYKHCYFSPLCLPVKMAPKTMIRPIVVCFKASRLQAHICVLILCIDKAVISFCYTSNSNFFPTAEEHVTCFGSKLTNFPEQTKLTNSLTKQQLELVIHT